MESPSAITAFFRQHWLILAILLLAGFFRLHRLSFYMEFLGDQGRDVVIVRDFLKNGNPFFIGPQTSIGNMYLGPYYYYLIVAPGLLLFNFNPIGPAVIIALLGIVTTWLIYFVAREWFSSSVGLVASLLYAISPVAIKYTTFSWNPNVLPLFSLLFIYFLTQRRLILASFAFIMALNSHFLAICLLPPAALIWFWSASWRIDDRSKYLRTTAIAVIIFLVSLTPQILFDIKHHGQNLGALVAFFSQRETTINLKIYKSLPSLIPLYTQLTTRLLAGKDEKFGPILSTVLAVAFVYYILLHRRKKLNTYFIFCLIWLLFGLVGLGLYKQHIYDHYFGFIYPVVFIITAVLIGSLGNLLGSVLLVFVIFFSLLQNPFRYPPTRQLWRTQEIDRSIIQASNNQEFNFALLAKQNYDPGYRYFFYEWGSPVRSLTEKMTNELYVVCEPDGIDCNPINNPKTEIANFGWAKIEDTWQIQSFKIFKLTHLLGEKTTSP